MKQVWQRISVREQRLLQALGAFLLIVVAFSLIWQPTRQRLETVERQHRHQLALVAQLQHAQPRSNAPADSVSPCRCASATTLRRRGSISTRWKQTSIQCA